MKPFIRRRSTAVAAFFKWPSWPLEERPLHAFTAAKTGTPERSIQHDPTRAKALGPDLDLRRERRRAKAR